MPMPIALAENNLNALAEILIEHFPEQYNQTVFQIIQQDKENINTSIGKIAQAVTMSDFVTECLKKQPHFLHEWWQKTPELADCDNYPERLHALLQHVQNDEALYKALRQFRNREMANLSFCQSLNLGTVEEIFIRLSQLAEALIIATRDWLYLQACSDGRSSAPAGCL